VTNAHLSLLTAAYISGAKPVARNRVFVIAN
jgi:hypothetical protein